MNHLIMNTNRIEKVILKRGQNFNSHADIEKFLKRKFVRYQVTLDDSRFNTIILYVGQDRQVYKKERFSGMIIS